MLYTSVVHQWIFVLNNLLHRIIIHYIDDK